MPTSVSLFVWLPEERGKWVEMRPGSFQPHIHGRSNIGLDERPGAGCHTALMTTAYPSPESYAVFNVAGKSPLMGVDVATRTRVSRIIGKPALQAVEIENLETGDRRIVDCDTLVLTGDWIPDHELARAAGLDMDPKTQGPLADTASRTSSPGVFAIGNLLHPVDTADIAALDGQHVAGSRPASCDPETSRRPATGSCCGPTPWFAFQDRRTPGRQGNREKDIALACLARRRRAWPHR
jgi:hypothetical protein